MARSVSIALRGLVLMGAVVLAPFAVRSAVASEGGTCPNYGRFVAQLDEYERPIALAFAPDGTLAVVEGDARRVRILALDGSASGREVRRIEAETAGPWGLGFPPGAAGPRAVGCDPKGQWTVLAPGRLVSFDAAGTRIRSFDTLPLREPSAMVWRGEELLVADPGLGAIVVLGPDGSERARWRGDLKAPAGLALRPDGSIVVADRDRHAIVFLDASGQETGHVGERGSFPGLFDAPTSVVARGDCLYVADELNHRIAVLGADGSFLNQWGMHAVVPREGQGKIHYPSAIAISPDGEQAVVAEPFERRLQQFGIDAGETNVATLPSRDGVQSHFGSAAASDGDLLLLSEPESSSIFVFDLRGEVPTHIATFGGPGNAIDKCGRIGALAVDASEQRIIVADVGNGRLAKYRLERDRAEPLKMDPFMPRLVRSYQLAAWSERARALADDTPAPDAPALAIAGLAIGSDAIWAIDGRDGWLVAFDWGLAPSACVRSPLRGTSSLTEVDDELLATCLPEEGAVVLLGRDGMERSRLTGPTDRPFVRPTSVARTRSGELAVTDAGADRVVILSKGNGGSWTVRSVVGRRGMSDGDFWMPDGVVRVASAGPGGAGRVVIIDRGNHRAQLLGEEGNWLMTFGLGRAYTRPRERGES